MWKIGKPCASLLASGTAAARSPEEPAAAWLGARSGAVGRVEAATMEEEEPATTAAVKELEAAAEPVAARLGTRCSAAGREEVEEMEVVAAEPATSGLGEVSLQDR